MSVKTVLRARQSARFAGAASVCVQPLSGFVSIDLDQPVRCREGQRSKQHGADHREHRCDGADADREREHDDGAESGIAAQRAHAVADVLQRRFDQRKATRFSCCCFLDLHRTSKLQNRPPARFVWRHKPRRTCSLDQHPEVRVDFGSELVHVAAPIAQAADTRGEDHEPGRHGVSVAASRKRPHHHRPRSAPSSAASVASCRRPLLVIA